jgi:energy-coupling factor transporter ATP-binding protein EcfA2
MISPSPAGPVLRTLAPALRQLEQGCRQWLQTPHRYPLPASTRADLEGLAADLRRQADALEVDRPLLVIMLMGGTGVGKSTLLNALAGAAIAPTSLVRPTTRDPVVYYHESIQASRLDKALQHCRLVQHDRPALEQKIIVDTPDLDSNDLANRDKLQQLLPVADIVLYVGSQEKYHDRLGWELFLHHRQRRAFAFVLNKWDRCVQQGAGGLRPDEDLLSDLKGEGFEHPLLFRTCARHWLKKVEGAPPHPQALSPEVEERGEQPPEGEQFADLVHWLEQGLSRLEIEAIKARGVSQLLQQLQKTLESVRPPDLTEAARRTRSVWLQTLAEEAHADAEVLLNTLEPYQREIEHHFALQRQRHFRGLMAGYLSLVNRLKYAGSSLRDRISILPRSQAKSDAPSRWDLSAFTRACSATASERQLDARGRALANRLLVQADEQGYPLSLLTGPTEAAARTDWRQRYAQALTEVLGQVEHEWARPTGPRRLVQAAVVLLANWAPYLALLGAIAVPLWRFFTQADYKLALSDFLVPVAVLLSVLILLHVLIALLLPLRWLAIRGEFQRQLERRLVAELEQVYVRVPEDVARLLIAERHEVEQLLGEVHEVAGWLRQREESAAIAGLYGK